MSILKVNNIERATSGSSTVTFTDNVTFGSSVNISSGSITASFAIANASIGKEKLTNDARDFVNILNKPAGLISSSGQFVSSISGSSLELGGIISTGSIRTTDVFSGSGAQLFGLPNAALNNSQITINGTAVSLGGTRTLTTSDISEGTNQYYTDARVKAKLNTETVVSSSGQINYQSVVGQPTVNTLGSDGNKAFTISTGIFVTASGGADGVIVTNDTANYTLRFRTVGGTVSSSAQVVSSLPAGTVSSSTQVQSGLPGGVVSSSAQYPGWVTSSTQIVWASVPYNANIVSSSAQFTSLTAPFSGSFTGSLNGRFTGSILSAGVVSASSQYPGWVTASSQIDYNSITNKLSGVVSASGQVQPLLPGGTVSSSAQYPGWVTASSQIDVRNTTGIATIATTGSNTFIGNQTISGSTTITGNLTVQGTSSVLYTTSSQLNVGTNTITLNTTSVLRYGGFSVADSGSVTNQSGSLYWDSVNNVWLFVHAGSTNTSSIVITGPENTGALGNEQFLTQNLLTKAGVTGDHIVNSQISDDGTQVGIAGSLKVTGSITSSFVSGALTGTFPFASLTGLPGLYSSSLQVSGTIGSAGITGSVSGALTGTFPYGSLTGTPANIVSSSAQVTTFLPASTVSSSTQFKTLTDPFTGSFTGSFVGTFPYTGLTSIPSGIMSSSAQTAANLPAGTVSSSGQINAGATSNFATAVAAQLGTVHSGSFMSTATTNNLPEGVTNLYYTDARVKSKMSGDVVHSGSFLGTATTDNLTQGSTNKYYANSLVLSYIDSLSVLSSSQQVVNRLPIGTVSSSTQIQVVQVNSASYAATASLALGVSGSLAVSTDGLNEGTINLYYTDARVKTKLNAENVHSASFLGTATTTNLTEGVNLYFTNARAIAALPGVISSSTQVPVLLPGGVVSSSAQYPGWVTSSAQVNTGSFTGSFIGAHTGSILAPGVVSSSAQYPGWVTSSTQVVWASVPYNTGIVSSSTQVQPLLPTGTVSQSAGTITVDGTNSIIGINTASPSTLTKLHINGAMMVENGVTSTNAFKDGIIFAYTGGSSQYRHKIVTRHDAIAALNLIEFLVATGASTSASVLTLNGTNPSSFYKGLNVTGSLAVQGSISGALVLPADTVSSSTQVKTFLPAGTVSSSAQYSGWVTASSQVDITQTTGYTTFSSSLATVDAGQTTRIDNLASLTSSYAINSTIQSQLAGVISSSAQTVSSIANQTITPLAVNATNVTASALSANQAVFTNASDGLVSNAITGTGNVVMSASPTFSGTITAASITANGTLLLQNIVSQSSAPSFTGLTSTGTVLLAGIYSSSGQTDITATTGYSTFSSSLATVDATQQISINALNAATSSYAINSTIQSQLAGVVSSSAQTVASVANQTIAPLAVNATNVTASALSANQAVFTNADDGLVSNAITGTGNVVMSASPTLTGTVTANNMIMSGSQFSGIVSGSGLQYRLVVPVGTNYYAT